MQAIVLAGGVGSRLRPITYTRPKPMIAVGNRPAIHHIVTAAAAAGLTEVLFTTNYMAEAIQAYCAAHPFPIPVRCVNEEQPLGTAGAVRNVADLITGPFVVIQGDSFSEIDLAALVAAHRGFGGLVTLAVMPVENPAEFGIVELDETSRIRRFLEKPKLVECFSNLANTGFYVLEREVLERIPAAGPYDFSFELFPALLQAGAPMYAWTTEAYWIDLGRVASYLMGNARCLGLLEDAVVAPDAQVSPEARLHRPCLIGERSVVEAGCEVGPFTAVGPDVRLEAGSRVSRSVLYERSTVEAGAVLEECVVAEECRVGRSARLARHVIVGRGCQIGADAQVLAGSRIGPFVRVEPASTIEGVLSPNLNRIEATQALLAAGPAFAGLDPVALRLCTILAEIGEAPAKTLARLAGVPFSQVHAHLFGLTQRGLLSARGEAPRLFALIHEDLSRVALAATGHR